MNKLLTSAEMREADEYTMNKREVPSQTLMERAGKALAEKAIKMLGGGRALCVCGGGNNGGDGFVCARLLMQAGYTVELVCIAERFSADCQTVMEKFRFAGGMVETTFPDEEYALIIDCLLGTGLKSGLSVEYANAIAKINEYKKRGASVLSADIPSGVNGDNGRVEKIAVRADATLCIGEIKAGVYLGSGIDHAGEISRADIGIALPKTSYAELTEKADVVKLLPKRKRNSHKGSYGKAAIVAGSSAYTGAAYLSTTACLRSGAGYTTLFVPKGILPYYILKCPEALLRPLCGGDVPVFNEGYFERLLSYDSIAYGMGMGATKEVAKGAKYLLKNYEGRLILDADALNALAIHTKPEKIFKNKKCDVVITPHIKEFSRLIGETPDEIAQGGLSAPKSFAKANRLTVYLKNAVSLVTDGEDIFVNVTGNAGLAKGGSGDVLSGVIAGLCAQGISALNGARIGGYIVGKAAEIAAIEQGEYSLLASDVIACLGKAFLSLED